MWKHESRQCYVMWYGHAIKKYDKKKAAIKYQLHL